MKTLTIEEINEKAPTLLDPITVECHDGHFKNYLKRIRIISCVDEKGRVSIISLPSKELFEVTAADICSHYPSAANKSYGSRISKAKKKKAPKRQKKAPGAMKNYQAEEPCLACGEMVKDRCYHHVIHRGRMRRNIDEPWNLMPLCQDHHNQAHESLLKLSDRFPAVERWLIVNDWELCSWRGKWIHESLEVQ